MKLGDSKTKLPNSKTHRKRDRALRTQTNTNSVEELVLSQDDQPLTYLTIREIDRDIGISKSSVQNIVKKDLRLKCLKKKRAQELTSANKLTRLVRAKQPNSTKPLISTKCYDNNIH